MTLIEHLLELRRRIIICAIAVCVAAIFAWFLYPWVSHFLLAPYRDIAERSIAGGNLIATSPVEGFAVRIKITAYVAIAFAMPIILWQIWRFVSPGLYKHERRYALPFVSSAIVLFALGASLAYWTLPKALDWLSSIGGNNITQAYTADKYYQLIAYMMLAFGICFEFPIVLVFLQMAGIVSNEWLRKYRRHAIVVIFIVVAVATPSNDPISLIALSLPLCVFYEGAIIVGRLQNRRKRRAAAAAASDR
jgi:sec-independent protein translocase protein TatC